MIELSKTEKESPPTRKGYLKISEFLNIPQGSIFLASSPIITKALIKTSAALCGFGNAPHVAGDVSALSLTLGNQGISCLCGSATICLMNAALEQAIVVDEPYDVLSFGYDNIIFESPAIEGGSILFTMIPASIDTWRFPIKRLKTSVPAIKVTLLCEGTHSITNKRVIKTTWRLCYMAMSDINHLSRTL